MSPANSIFIPDAQAVARAAIEAQGHGELADKFSIIIKYLEENPGAASKLRSRGVEIGSEEYIHLAALQFVGSRKKLRPTTPSTIPDEMVSFILHHWFGIPEDQLQRIKAEHQLSMGAENMVGDLLERYLAEGLEPAGWVWISGSLITGADFLLPLEGGKWNILQVKNRSNSENSSSSHIRVGTEIDKWHRTDSKKPGARWEKFPHVISRVNFSEEGFKQFAQQYLQSLKEDS